MYLTLSAGWEGEAVPTKRAHKVGRADKSRTGDYCDRVARHGSGPICQRRLHTGINRRHNGDRAAPGRGTAGRAA